MADLSGVQVGRAGPDDARDLLELVNLVQPHVPWDERHLRWQFFEPPTGPARLWIIRRGRAIISMYVAIRQRLRAAGRLHTAFMVQDVMSHPEYRGRGFLHHLGRLCLDEIRAAGDAGYTFPNKRSEGSFRRLGWDEHGRVPQRVAPSGKAGCDRVHAVRIAALPTFGPPQELVWASADVDAGVERDAAFLEWRYRKPGQEYHRYSIADDQGFLVFKLFDGGMRTLHICDLVVRASARELVPAALAFIHGEARARGAARVTSWLPARHPYSEAFDAAGLELDATHDRFMFTTGPGRGVPWHVTQGDSDVH
jgi:Acetyltransferase (GNAT) domain